MILVDTNVIIEFWKSPTDTAEKVFIEEKVCICGVGGLTGGLSHQNSFIKENKLWL